MKRLKLSAEGRLRASVRVALAIGATSVALGGTAFAADAEPATQLEKVQVTGSRIRAVDIQTSNPVFTIDRAGIRATGATTIGELLQSLPAAAGVVTNPQVNNGGGNGGAEVNLRGLGGERTLVLLDGRRVIGTTFSDISYVDLNTFPVNMIERIEILKEGASAIYGSGAIGGVVNILTRKRFTAGELEGTYGRTQHNDGTRQNVNATWGSGTNESHVVVGLNYERQNSINASARPLTSHPTAFYYTALDPNAGTSGRVPGGRWTLPAGSAARTHYGCGSVTRLDGHSGASEDDYRCFVNNAGPGATDRYNFLPDNLLLTPSKRYEIFALGEHDVTHDIQFYGSGYFTHTQSNAQLAAEPFDNGTASAVIGRTTISKDNIYNPFGTDISTFALRPTLVGDRIETVNTSTYQATAGFKGLLDRFQWDTAYTFGRIDQHESDYGFLNFANLKNQLGPSFYSDASGNQVPAGTAGATPVCGTPGHIIPQCTPVNPFGTVGNTIASLGTTANTIVQQDQQTIDANIGGDVVQLPAGPLAANVGFEYRKYTFSKIPDGREQSFELSENNSLTTQGTYNVREYYAEFRVPLLAGLPGVESLTLTPGTRYSNYSSFGNTVNSKIGLEYRPYNDLLIRANYADVFRAPTVNDLFKGALQDSPGFTDPCNGYGGPNNPQTANGDLACQNVPTDGTFKQLNTQASAVRTGNTDLKPEKGFMTDFGLVFNPSWYHPLTVEVDYFKYSINKNIGLLDSQNSVNACFNQGQLCQFVGRDSDGQLNASIEPTFNLGALVTQGLDFGIRLSYPKAAVGSIALGGFVLSVDTTYLQKWETSTVVAGQTLDFQSLAGQTDGGGNGTFPRWKSFATLTWNLGPFSASLRDRFIGTVGEGSVYFNGNPDSAIDVNDAGQCGTTNAGTVPADPSDPTGLQLLCHRSVGVANYVDLSGTYALKVIDTSFTFGVTDLFNQGGKFTASSILAGGTGYPTDPAIYDITGRAFFTRVKVEFK